MKKKLRFAGIIPALALSSMLTFGAGAQGVVDDVIDGAENIVTDTIDTADEILTGDETTVGESTENGEIQDIPEQMEDDADSGADGVETAQENGNEANPGTGIGIPFMTAGLVAVSAAGVAYLTKKRREENGTE